MAALLGELAPRLQRFGLRLCGNAHDADDVLQETLLSIAQHIEQFEGRSAFLGWAFALARSACNRRRRGLKNAPPHVDEHAAEQRDAAPSPEALTADRELVRAVSGVLDDLPLESREVILLRDVEGLSAAEAAEALGISQQALKSRLHRARTMLRDRLRPMLEPDVTVPGGDCPDVMTLWSRQLEGDLSALDCARMQAHVSSCKACGSACDALKRALDACHRSAETEVPPEVQARVRAAVRDWSAARGGQAG
jgi:RNA polymerase sigma-70 factor (ECF subfamily)